MELFKNFSLGGLFQSGRKMAAPWGSFRRFTNAYKDATGTIRPYGKGVSAENMPTLTSANTAYFASQLLPLASHYYNKGILQLHAGAIPGFPSDLYVGSLSYTSEGGETLPIMQPFSLGHGTNYVAILKHKTYLPSGNLSTCTVARKAFINSSVNTADFDTTKPFGSKSPEENYLMSFDGLRPRGAGLPTPWRYWLNSGAPAAHYARAVYATIGIDGEVIFSGYRQAQLSSAVETLYLSGYTAYPSAPLTDAAPATPYDTLFEETRGAGNVVGAPASNTRYFDKRYIKKAFSTPVFAATGLTFPSCTYSAALEIGDWVMSSGFPLPMTIAELSMFQVQSIAGSTIVLEAKYKYLDPNTLTWTESNYYEEYTLLGTLGLSGIDRQLQIYGTIENGITLSNIFMIVAYSTSPTAGFIVSTISPVLWDSASGVAFPYSFQRTFTRPWAGVVTSSMSDWYDVTTSKTTFPPLRGITNYKELLVGFDANALYFSDVSLGGSTEMLSGVSNAIPYGSEYGEIVAICGSEDFLLVCRERKNYVITGDLAANFNITECDSAIFGAHNNNCVTNAWAGQVLFSNKTGIYSVNSSGSITDISKEIKGLFIGTNVDENLFDKSIYKTLTQTRSDGKDGGIFKFALDSRGFILFFTGTMDNSTGLAVEDSNIFVLNTNDGKWYEFEGNGSSTVESIDGKILSLGNVKYLEDGVMRGAEAQLLVSQWMTVDTPSLEKRICQLKMFGEFTPRTDTGVRGMVVGQQNNWKPFVSSNRTDWNTYSTYLPGSHEIYFHKKRLDSSLPLATSIVLESLPTGSFTLDGMEIEGVSSSQEGIKK